MKKIFPLLFLCFVSFLPSYGQSSGLVVQVAAFDRSVSLDYFQGLEGVHHFEDHNNIHRYYISGFSDQAAADAVAKKATTLGYNARVIDMDKQRNTCSLTCGMVFDPSKIQSIFFDFDKSSLRGESKRQLDQLYGILVQNPDYSVELSAHTDAKGSFGYNDALSRRRANAAKDYLLEKGIPASRLKVSTSGENSPIAKNELNGQDTPEGRQLNRRVELIVFNTSGSVEPVVEKIVVPVILQQ